MADWATQYEQLVASVPEVFYAEKSKMVPTIHRHTCIPFNAATAGKMCEMIGARYLPNGECLDYCYSPGLNSTKWCKCAERITPIWDGRRITLNGIGRAHGRDIESYRYCILIWKYLKT
jgi:hypothetical protein